MEPEKKKRALWERLKSWLSHTRIENATGVCLGLAIIGCAAWSMFGGIAPDLFSRFEPAAVLGAVGLTLTLISSLRGVFESRLSIVEGELKALQSANDTRSLAGVKAAFEHLEPAYFASVVEEPFDYMHRNLSDLFSAKKVKIYNPQLFATIYEKCLRTLCDAEFFATALARRSYFWDTPGIMTAIAKFTSGGGRMTRIFVLDGAGDLHDAEVCTILEEQVAAGVSVFTVLREQVPTELSGFWMVDFKDERIAWEVIATHDRRVAGFEITADRDRVHEYRLRMDQLKKLPLREYVSRGKASGRKSLK